MYSVGQISQVIGVSSGVLFQYRQVQNLVNYLMRYYNVSRLLAISESSTFLVESKEKRFSSLYAILLTSSYLQDRSTANWEKDWGTKFLDVE